MNRYSANHHDLPLIPFLDQRKIIISTSKSSQLYCCLAHKRRRWLGKIALLWRVVSLMGKETDEHRTSNVQHRTSNECILSVFLRFRQAITSFVICNSAFDFLLSSDHVFSVIRCLIQAIEAASLMIKKSCYFGVVSYEGLGRKTPRPLT